MQLLIQNQQNTKLLDGMHEGLIILLKSNNQQLLFSNRPIEKFINAAILANDKFFESTEDHWLLSPKLFKPIQVTAKEQDRQKKQTLNLEQIITAQIDEP